MSSLIIWQECHINPFILKKSEREAGRQTEDGRERKRERDLELNPLLVLRIRGETNSKTERHKLKERKLTSDGVTEIILSTLRIERAKKRLVR